MQIRHAVHPDQAVMFDTAELREHFLVQDLFNPGELKMVYSHYDRLIVAGACPVDDLKIEADPAVIGAAYLLERREMGVINIGAPGAVVVDGTRHDLGTKDGLYIGRGAREVTCASTDPHRPAKFYLNCAPAHAAHPTRERSPRRRRRRCSWGPWKRATGAPSASTSTRMGSAAASSSWG